MDYELKGKVAIITGGTSGIGLETARIFAEGGAKVTITGRDENKLERAAEDLRKSGDFPGALGCLNQQVTLTMGSGEFSVRRCDLPRRLQTIGQVVLGCMGFCRPPSLSHFQLTAHAMEFEASRQIAAAHGKFACPPW